MARKIKIGKTYRVEGRADFKVASIIKGDIIPINSDKNIMKGKKSRKERRAVNGKGQSIPISKLEELIN